MPTAAGVTVAIIDSGVERDHPAVGGRLSRSVVVELDAEGEPVVVDDPERDRRRRPRHRLRRHHPRPRAGRGARLDPRPGPDNRGKGIVFAAGLDWAIEHGAEVVNLQPVSSKSDALYGTFHELADRAYFANVLLVSAANNVPGPSYPSLFAAVVSVAAHDVPDAAVYYYNPSRRSSSGPTAWTSTIAWQGRHDDDRDRQQLRGPAHRRLRGAHPLAPP